MVGEKLKKLPNPDLPELSFDPDEKERKYFDNNILFYIISSAL